MVLSPARTHADVRWLTEDSGSESVVYASLAAGALSFTHRFPLASPTITCSSQQIMCAAAILVHPATCCAATAASVADGFTGGAGDDTQRHHHSCSRRWHCRFPLPAAVAALLLLFLATVSVLRHTRGRDRGDGLCGVLLHGPPGAHRQYAICTRPPPHPPFPHGLPGTCVPRFPVWSKQCCR